MVMPPRNNRCCFCGESFFLSSGFDSWFARMEHIARHHQIGHSLSHAQPDFELIDFLWNNYLIDEVMYRELKQNTQDQKRSTDGISYPPTLDTTGSPPSTPAVERVRLVAVVNERKRNRRPKQPKRKLPVIEPPKVISPSTVHSSLGQIPSSSSLDPLGRADDISHDISGAVKIVSDDYELHEISQETVEAPQLDEDFNKPSSNDNFSISKDVITSLPVENAQVQLSSDTSFRINERKSENALEPENVHKKTTATLDEGPPEHQKSKSKLTNLTRMTKVRIRWTCRCGHPLYDDFEELRPNAAHEYDNLLRKDIRSRTERSKIQASSNSQSSGSISGILSLLGSYKEWRQRGKPLLPRNNSENRTGDQLQTSGPPFSIIGQAGTDSLFLLLCVPQQRYGTKLIQPCLTDISTDRSFFFLLRQRYRSMYGRWKRISHSRLCEVSNWGL